MFVIYVHFFSNYCLSGLIKKSPVDKRERIRMIQLMAVARCRKKGPRQHLASLGWPVSRTCDACMTMLRQSPILERVAIAKADALKTRGYFSETMSLSIRRRGLNRERRPQNHATRKSRPCERRLSSRILSTSPCLHIRHNVAWAHNSRRQRTSQLEWSRCASSHVLPPVFAERCRDRQA